MDTAKKIGMRFTDEVIDRELDTWRASEYDKLELERTTASTPMWQLVIKSALTQPRILAVFASKTEATYVMGILKELWPQALQELDIAWGEINSWAEGDVLKSSDIEAMQEAARNDRMALNIVQTEVELERARTRRLRNLLMLATATIGALAQYINLTHNGDEARGILSDLALSTIGYIQEAEK